LASTKSDLKNEKNNIHLWEIEFHFLTIHYISLVEGMGERGKSFGSSGDDRLRSYPNNRFHDLKTLSAFQNVKKKEEIFNPYVS
jgi:hypothetical protein